MTTGRAQVPGLLGRVLGTWLLVVLVWLLSGCAADVDGTANSSNLPVIDSYSESISYLTNRGDGVSDDTRAIQKAIDACPLGGIVMMPAGTFRLTEPLRLERDVSIVGTPGACILAASFSGAMLDGSNVSDVTLSGLTFQGQGGSALTYGLTLSDALNVTMKDLTFYDLTFGLFIGSSAGLTSDTLTAKRCSTPLYMANASDSSFTNLDLQSPNLENTNQWHGMYLERGNRNLTFKNLKITGASGYCLQLYTQDEASDHLTFENVTLDATTGRYPMVIWGYSNVTFNNLSMAAGRSDGPCVRLGGSVSNLVVDGFTASGGDSLCEPYPGDTPKEVAFRNGTYAGTSLGSGATFENVSLTETAITILGPTTSETKKIR